VNFQISITDISLKYVERAQTEVGVDVVTIDNYVNREKYTAVRILFDSVADKAFSAGDNHDGIGKARCRRSKCKTDSCNEC